MKQKLFVLLILLSYVTFVSACSEETKSKTHDHEAESHEGHDHESTEEKDTESHEGHDHQSTEEQDTESHEGHDHQSTEEQDTESTEGHDHESTEEHDTESHEGHDHESTEGHDHGSTKETGDILVSAKQLELMGIETITIEKKDFAEVLKTSGEVMPAQGDKTVIVAKADGIVFFSGRNIVPGAKVSKGQLLFTIAGSDLNDNNLKVTYENKKAELKKADEDMKRAEELRTARIMSVKDYSAVKLAYSKIESEFSALSENYRGKGKQIMSPSSGWLSSVLVDEGQFVTAGTPIASVSENRRLMIKAEVSQKDYPTLPTIRAAHFKTGYDNCLYSTDQLNGRLISYGKSTDRNSYYLPIYFEVDNRAAIIPGSFIEVFLLGTPIPDAVVVPKSALLEEQGSYYVFVQKGADSFEKRFVVLGAEDGWEIMIKKGLSENETVVIQGIYRLKLASMPAAMPANGHSH
ncbi:MAG: efflux RND transporter periplasmic adaptor subunit [Candidatus Kapabacteria bacterium]|jgi:RND family efflux transporter MFP subunit|nr:efflux RND transporter periplasmic adaptor subunit [Candidatus Kapabacteria bacterium]